MRVLTCSILCLVLAGCPSPPLIEQVEPLYGKVGTELTIRGKNLGSIQDSGRVIFHDSIDASEALFWSREEIRVVVPAGAGTGPVRVEVWGEESNSTSFIVNHERLPHVPVGKYIPDAFGNYDVIAADFNSDGILDLATDITQILLGNGDGSFEDKGYYAPAAGSSPVAGDFNEDGILDLATSGGKKIKVLLLDEEMNFDEFHEIAFETYINYMTLGDFNNDAHLDIAVLRSGEPGVVKILLGDGLGGFTPHGEFEVRDVPYYSIIPEDFDYDGNLDLAVTNTGSCASCVSEVSILLGDGTGGFPVITHIPAGHHPWSLATGDFNRDGLVDLAVACKGYSSSSPGELLIWLGDGLGRFEEVVREPYYDYSIGGLLKGDFNRDGVLDLSFGFGGYSQKILLGDGTGNFIHLEDLWGVGGVANADFNMDGIGDMVTPTEGTLVLFTGDGGGSFGAVKAYDSGRYSAKALSADLDLDGNKDLVVQRNRYWDVRVMFGDGAGGFREIREVPLEEDADDIVIGDFNGDGITDLATVNDLTIYFGDGNGDFAVAGIYPLRTGSITTGDFDGDSTLDIATNTGQGLSVFYNDGQGDFSDQEVFPLPSDVDFDYRINQDDFNRDGFPDVFSPVEYYSPSAEEYVSEIGVLLSDGAGGFGEPAMFPTGGWAITSLSEDMNGDGAADILVRNGYEDDHIVILYGDGGGSFSDPVTVFDPVLERIIVSMAPADLDGDGNKDLAITSGNRTSILLGDGLGSFIPHADLPTFVRPFYPVPLDLNHDGYLDLAVSNNGVSSSGTGSNLTVFLGDGTGGFVDFD